MAMTGASDDWTECSRQEITKLAARLRGRRQFRAARRAAFVAAAAMATVAIVALAVWPSPGTDEGPDFAGISCKRVAELANAYVKRELPPELQDQVRRHIALCPMCRKMFEEMPAVSQRRLNGILEASATLPHWELAQRRSTPSDHEAKGRGS
jgi:Putative zinc-finger